VYRVPVGAAWSCCRPNTVAASHAAFLQRHRELLKAKTGGANIKVLGIGEGAERRQPHGASE